MENQRKTGFVPQPIEENQYLLGSLGDAVIKVDGNWKDYLPSFESQLEKNFDTFGCTCFGTLNAIETLEKFLTQKEQNYSDRFVYNGVGITPPGSDPHVVSEYIRKTGLIFEIDLPDETTSLAEFETPRPVTQDLLVKAGKWAWTLSHQWIITPSTPKDQRVSILKAELLKGTVCISVTAWYKNAQGLYYSPQGLQNEHWTMVYDVRDDGVYVFDSYTDATLNTNLKKLTLDHDIQYAKRYTLTKKLTEEKRIFFLSWLRDILYSLLNIEKQIDALPKEPAVVTTLSIKDVPPTPKYLWDDFDMIRHSMRLIGDEFNMTVLQKDLLCDIARCESGYNIKAIGIIDKRDRGIFQINSRYHPEATDEKAFNPEWATRWACQAILQKKAHTYYSASEPCWNKTKKYDSLL